MTLKAEVFKLADDFAQGVLAAIRSTSLEQLLLQNGVSHAGRTPKSNGAGRRAIASPAPTQKANGRLHRRSDEELGATTDQIVALLQKHPQGLRAENIRAELGIAAKELPRPLKDAVAARRVSKKGEKRATTYFAK